MKFLLAAVLGATLVAAPATAAITTSQTLSGSLGPAFLLPGGFSTTLNFNPFNNPGETLTSVRLSFTTGFQSDFIVTNVNLFGSPSSRQITLARGISGAINGNGFSLADTDIVSKTQTVGRPAVVSFGNYAASVGGEDTLLAGNPVFTGPGPVSFAFSASQFGNTLTGTPNLGLTTALPNLLTASSFYDVTLTYESEAIPPIPEPATWAMMMAGFGLAGAALRRRRAVTTA
jgi:hypothetical protein